MIEIPSKERMIDSKGSPLTQGLFLEKGYNPEFAVYTLKPYHFEYKGVLYPSIRKLYIEMEDPVEYDFANTYFLSWKHWKQITANKQLLVEIQEWREELELKLRARGVKSMISSASVPGKENFQAAKWLVDRGWTNKGAGRPSKEEVEREKQFQARIHDEFKNDFDRLQLVK